MPGMGRLATFLDEALERQAVLPSTEVEVIMDARVNSHSREPWNKGKLVGQKLPLKIKDIWAIRVRLQMQERIRDRAMFDLGIDSKLRACDLVKLRVRDVCNGDRVASRAIVLQQKTQRPVQFEITASTREALEAWIRVARLKADELSVFEPVAGIRAS